MDRSGASEQPLIYNDGELVSKRTVAANELQQIEAAIMRVAVADPTWCASHDEAALRQRLGMIGLTGIADGSAEVGVIASVTQPFCGDCTRARMTADGQLYTCLFGSRGHDLRAPLRSGASDAELRDMVTRVWAARDDRYSELRTRATVAGRELPVFVQVNLGGEAQKAGVDIADAVAFAGRCRDEYGLPVAGFTGSLTYRFDKLRD